MEESLIMVRAETLQHQYKGRSIDQKAKLDVNGLNLNDPNDQLFQN